ncbi:MAG: NAD(P)/FAD-dependent oxidoreductase [Acidobacteria bacterium]|nr:NAD(P)/FAD-dependent oxidoreductase [Acidobacteriota bacterium]
MRSAQVILMGNREHAFVVGGGPAGLVAAIALRRKGLHVTVADGGDFPSDKACGEGILPEGLAALERLGISLDPNEGRTFHGICFINARTTAEATFPFRSGLGMRRVVLHRQLLRAAENFGVEMLQRTPVTNLSSNCVSLGAKKVSADWIIGADGFHSRVKSWTGLDRGLNARLRYAFRLHFVCAPWSDMVEVHWSQHAQLYITPVSNTEVGVVVLSRDPQLRVREALQYFPQVLARLGGADSVSAERGAVTGNCFLASVHAGKVALIGDASGSVDAITGEGLSLAFRQAEALAEAIANRSLANYGRAHKRLRLRAAIMARMLLLLERQPRLQERVVSALAAEPDIFRRMLAAHVGHISPISLATASARLGLLLLASNFS